MRETPFGVDPQTVARLLLNRWGWVWEGVSEKEREETKGSIEVDELTFLTRRGLSLTVQKLLIPRTDLLKEVDGSGDETVESDLVEEGGEKKNETERRRGLMESRDGML